MNDINLSETGISTAGATESRLVVRVEKIIRLTIDQSEIV